MIVYYACLYIYSRFVCDAVFVQRVSAQPRREPQGGGAVRGRMARQETDAVPLLLRHDVAGHGHRREDVQHRRRRAQVSPVDRIRRLAPSILQPAYLRRRSVECTLWVLTRDVVNVKWWRCLLRFVRLFVRFYWWPRVIFRPIGLSVPQLAAVLRKLSNLSLDSTTRIKPDIHYGLVKKLNDVIRYQSTYVGCIATGQRTLLTSFSH